MKLFVAEDSRERSALILLGTFHNNDRTKLLREIHLVKTRLALTISYTTLSDDKNSMYKFEGIYCMQKCIYLGTAKTGFALTISYTTLNDVKDELLAAIMNGY